MNYNPVVSQQTSYRGNSFGEGAGSTPVENAVPGSKKSIVTSNNSQVSPSIKFGTNKKNNKANKTKARKDTYQEEVEELDVPDDKGREVKSVIKEAPEKAEVQESDDSVTDDNNKSNSKSDISNNRITPDNDMNDHENKESMNEITNKRNEFDDSNKKKVVDHTSGKSNQKDSDMNIFNLEMESGKEIYDEQKDPSSTKINVKKIGQHIDQQRSNSNQDKAQPNKHLVVDRK